MTGEPERQEMCVAQLRKMQQMLNAQTACLYGGGTPIILVAEVDWQDGVQRLRWSQTGFDVYTISATALEFTEHVAQALTSALGQPGLLNQPEMDRAAAALLHMQQALRHLRNAVCPLAGRGSLEIPNNAGCA